MAIFKKSEAKLMKSKKIFIYGALALIVIAGAVVGVYLNKNANYNKAIALFDDEKPIKARELFEDLGRFKDSADYLSECNDLALYDEAAQVLDEGDYTSAINKFTELDGYKDSDELLQQAENHIKYEEALSLLSSEEYEQAQIIFTELNGFEDSRQLAEDCRIRLDYEEAVSLMESGENEDAKLIFEKIREYEDSETLELICEYRILYIQAAEKVKAEDFADAWEILRLIKTNAKENDIDLSLVVDYDEFMQVKSECYKYVCYNNGIKLYDDGSYYYAYLQFNKAEGVLDADDKALSCIQTFSTEEIYVNPDYAENEVALIFRSNKDYVDICCRIYSGNTLVSMMTIKRGARLTIKLPDGVYSFKYGKGENWFGDQGYFGEQGEYFKSYFDKDNRFMSNQPYSKLFISVFNYYIDLGVSEGNTESREITFFEFCK